MEDTSQVANLSEFDTGRLLAIHALALPDVKGFIVAVAGDDAVDIVMSGTVDNDSMRDAFEQEADRLFYKYDGSFPSRPSSSLFGKLLMDYKAERA